MLPISFKNIQGLFETKKPRNQECLKPGNENQETLKPRNQKPRNQKPRAKEPRSLFYFQVRESLAPLNIPIPTRPK